MSSNELPTLLTTEEVSKMLRVTRKCLHTWRKNNTGPAYVKMGEGKNAQICYTPEAINKWVSEHTNPCGEACE